MKKGLTVLSLIGPSASGKSTVLNQLRDKHEVLEEKYMDLNKFKLDNRLLISKWAYLNYWLNNIILAKNEGLKFIITDRCPYDTCAYVTNHSEELFKILLESFNELNKIDIDIKTILMTADFDTLQERIDVRIQVEKNREFYNEKNTIHNQNAYNFFKSKKSYWDYIVDTTLMTKNDVEKSIDEIILNL